MPSGHQAPRKWASAYSATWSLFRRMARYAASSNPTAMGKVRRRKCAGAKLRMTLLCRGSEKRCLKRSGVSLQCQECARPASRKGDLCCQPCGIRVCQYPWDGICSQSALEFCRGKW